MSTPKAMNHLLNAQDSFRHNNRLLELPEVMDLAADSDVIYSLQVWATAFRIISDFVIDEFRDKELSSDVLQICQEALRRPVFPAPRKKPIKRNDRLRRQTVPFVEGGLKLE